MPTIKITPADRKLLVDLYASGHKRQAQTFALSLGLSRYYGCILYQRQHHSIRSRKSPDWVQQQEARHGE